MLLLKKNFVDLLAFSIVMLVFLQLTYHLGDRMRGSYEVVEIKQIFEENIAIKSTRFHSTASSQNLSSIQTSAEINSIQYNTSGLFDLTSESNVHQFHALHQPEIYQCDQSICALVLVCGRADDFEYRDTIRKTWANHAFIGTKPTEF
jgi:hypothetical protein